jgi:hypothetical protein
MGRLALVKRPSVPEDRLGGLEPPTGLASILLEKEVLELQHDLGESQCSRVSCCGRGTICRWWFR